VDGVTPVFAYQWILIWQHKSVFLNGIETAVKVALVAFILSVLFGLLLALARMSRPPLSWLAALYVNVFRGVPALVTVIWVYFGLSLVIGINFSVFDSGVIALTLLYSAFISEIYRAALLSIHRGQREAGLALGMRPHRVFVRVILPQATKIAIPNLGSMFIGMIKDTSTFVIIGLSEVAFQTNNLEQTYFQPFVLYTAAGGIYVIATFIIDFLFRTVEQTLTVPPRGGVAGFLARRRRRRIIAVIEGVEGVSQGT
jgi:His/Glu/Gln/Arg/opine family amino acid ABC transporter permease subunit